MCRSGVLEGSKGDTKIQFHLYNSGELIVVACWHCLEDFGELSTCVSMVEKIGFKLIDYKNENKMVYKVKIFYNKLK